jgi:hypothetical protein
MVLAGVLAFLACACSSSAKQGSTGGAGGTGGASGAGGVSGSGGVSGAGGTAGAGGRGGTSSVSGSGGGGAHAVDAAIDRAPTDARHDTGSEAGTSPQDQACRAAFQAQCESLVACGYNDLDECLAEAIFCPDYYFSPASGLTVQGVTDCLPSLSKITCTDWDLQLRPTCLAAGTRPPGAACVHGTDCQSEGCSGRNKACGTCRDLLPATGESCANSACRAGDFCHPKTQLCTPASTIVYANMGESCDLSATPVVGCAGSLHCIAPTAGTTAGTCRPALGNGESCAGSGAICGPGLECYNMTACQPIPVIPPYVCGDAGVCSDSTYCSEGAHPTCLPAAGVGQVCAPDGGTLVTKCVSPAVCLGVPGICTLYGNAGDPCNTTTQPCGGLYLVCVNGRCGTFETSYCPYVPGDAGRG